MLLTVGSTPRRRFSTAMVVAAALLTGCSTEPDPAPPGSGESDTAAIQAVEQTAEDQVRDIYAAYWEAVIASENGPDPDPALFDGVAVGEALDRQMFRVTGLIANKIRRVGKPVVGEPHITVTGATARVEACVDQDPWSAVIDGATPQPQSAGPRPMIVDLELIDGRWLVTSQISQEEATLTC